MVKRVSVAEAKRDFSELMGRVTLRGEKFIVERRGKGMVALVPLKDLQKLEAASEGSEKSGLLAMIGAWEDYPHLEQWVSRLYESRQRAKDRKIKKLS
ncbi:MAG: type II toxin-antitoxin system Phd/YefM family antitoxin [Deltaproteobacteria bacterium]|nr:type II toxin-antitoxin system Phd/YefM family antitoxin [Deltaproteobacteria bacterium]